MYVYNVIYNTHGFPVVFKTEVFMAIKYKRLRFELSGFRDINEVQYAFGILKRKNRKRVFYVIDAMDYYEKVKNKRNAFRNSLSTLRALRVLQSQYKIESRDDIIDIFENTDLEELKKGIPDEKDSFVERMVISFQIDDPKHIEAFDFLMSMSYSDRINYLVTIIKCYVEDGRDIDQTIIEANEFLYDIITEYRETKDPAHIDNFEILIRSCDKIKISSEEMNRYETAKSNFSDEVMKLFINEQDFLNYIR